MRVSKPSPRPQSPNRKETARELEIFCACSPGLEPILAAEIESLGLVGTAQPGGVALRGGARELLLANLWLRCASRVLVRLGSFDAKTFPQLIAKARELPFASVLGAAQSVALKATCRKSRLYHSGAVIERVHAALESRLGRKVALVAGASDDDETEASPSTASANANASTNTSTNTNTNTNTSTTANPAALAPQLLLIRFERDRCTISADASGALLHRRGYRTQLSRAPLRETLAAALLLAAGYRGGPLVDPCCGGGTIPIEAALIAQHRAPGLARGFACEQWSREHAQLAERLRQEARASETPLVPGLLAGSDVDPRALAAAEANARAAGFADRITFSCQPLERLRAADLKPGTLLAANPSYGKRAGAPGPELVALWSSLGALARAHQGPAALLCPSNELARAAGPEFRALVRTQNGGLPVSLLVSPGTAIAG